MYQGYVEKQYDRRNTWKAQDGKQRLVIKYRMVNELLIGGSRACGKSELELAHMADPYYWQHERFQGFVFRKNEKDLGDFINRCRFFFQGIATVVGRPPELRFHGKKSKYVFCHWKDKNAIASYLGHEYQKIIGEELTQCIPSLEEYKRVLSINRSNIPGCEATACFSTNPGGIGHKWVKEHWVDICNMKPYTDPNTGSVRMFIPMTIEDNPLFIKNDPRYYAELRNLKNINTNLYKAWYLGDWDIFDGQFYMEHGKKIEPHKLDEKAHGRLYGAVDIGLGTYTSFGLYYIAEDGHIELLLSYLKKGNSHQWHAEGIRDKISYFSDWIDGAFPEKIFIGADAWRASQNYDGEYSMPIHQYEEAFRNYGVEFVKCGTSRSAKEHGCALCHQVFQYGPDGEDPTFLYWDSYNIAYEKGITGVIGDEHNLNIYEKQNGDDVADQVRYFMEGAFAVNAVRLHKRRMEQRRIQERKRIYYGKRDKDIIRERYRRMLKPTSMA